MGPKQLGGIFLTLPVTIGEGIGPAGESFPVVCMLKNGLLYAPRLYPLKKKREIARHSFIASERRCGGAFSIGNSPLLASS